MGLLFAFCPCYCFVVTSNSKLVQEFGAEVPVEIILLMNVMQNRKSLLWNIVPKEPQL